MLHFFCVQNNPLKVRRCFKVLVSFFSQNTLQIDLNPSNKWTNTLISFQHNTFLFPFLLDAFIPLYFPSWSLANPLRTFCWTKPFIHTGKKKKMKPAVCEQVLTVILARQQHMPGCSFQNDSQDKTEWRTKLTLIPSLISWPSCSVMFFFFFLVIDPKRIYFPWIHDCQRIVFLTHHFTNTWVLYPISTAGLTSWTFID